MPRLTWVRHRPLPFTLDVTRCSVVYFYLDESTKCVKIGFTSGSVEGRRRALQTGCPGILRLLLSIQGTQEDERAWHHRFADARRQGEWFHPEPDLLLAIMDAKEKQLSARNDELEGILLKARLDLGHVSVFASGELRKRSIYPGRGCCQVALFTNGCRVRRLRFAGRIRDVRTTPRPLLSPNPFCL